MRDDQAVTGVFDILAYAFVRVRGALDDALAPLVAQTVAEAHSQGQHVIAIDLSGARVRGRYGLAPLIGALKSCRDRGGELYLIGASPMVARVLGHDTRGPVKCFDSLEQLDLALWGSDA